LEDETTKRIGRKSNRVFHIEVLYHSSNEFFEGEEKEKS